MQAAGNPWGSFILTPHCYRYLQLLRAQSDTHGLHSSRTGQWDDPEDSPHEARPTSSLSKANMGIRFKMSVLNEGQFFLAPATEVILPMALDLVIKNQLHMVCFSKCSLMVVEEDFVFSCCRQ